MKFVLSTFKKHIDIPQRILEQTINSMSLQLQSIDGGKIAIGNLIPIDFVYSEEYNVKALAKLDDTILFCSSIKLDNNKIEFIVDDSELLQSIENIENKCIIAPVGLATYNLNGTAVVSTINFFDFIYFETEETKEKYLEEHHQAFELAMT